MRTIHWFRLMCLVAVWSVITLSVNAQREPSNKQVEATIQITGLEPIDLARVAAVSAEIRKQRPQIPEPVLHQDARLIGSALPAITREFWKSGLSEDDAFWAALRGWKSARLESPLRLEPAKPMDESSFIRHVTNDVGAILFRWRIRQEKPEISSQVLNRDIVLISRSQPEISAAFEKRGLDASDARQASLFAWSEVRLKSALGPNQAMSRSSFVAFVENSTGIVMFDSEPDQADVFMGSNKIGTTSKEKARRLGRTFEDGKKVIVTFTKPEFVPETRECFAKGRDTVECKVELKRHQQ
ncbi:MAG: hypothetical protein H7Z16_10580 [Pyrinomonadaceae bacterium]|nr:hypothetical protein [Pyrinomonadaceae bacterium]